VEALCVPEGATLFRTTTDGQILAYVFWKGAFITVEQKRELDGITAWSTKILKKLFSAR
jgi:hypothetical protein